MKNLITALLVALFCSACATQYGQQGFTGGYKETQLAPDVWRVNVQGNGYTSAERVADFALLRAAELTLDHGYSYFVVASEQDRTKLMAWNSGTTATVSGNTIFIGPSRTAYLAKPGSTIIIKALKTQPAGDFGFDAVFLDKSIRERYKIKPRG